MPMIEEDWDELVTHLRFELARHLVGLNCAQSAISLRQSQRKVEQYERIVTEISKMRGKKNGKSLTA